MIAHKEIIELYNNCINIVNFIDIRFKLCDKAQCKYGYYSPQKTNEIRERIILNIPEKMFNISIWNTKKKEITGNYKQIYTAIQMSKGFGIPAFCKIMNIDYI